MAQSARYVSWLNNLTLDDTQSFGIKSEELVQILEADLKVPEGFAVSANAYSEYVRENNFTNKIKNLLSSANYGNPGSIEQVSFNIRNLLKKGTVPNHMVREIISSYRKLGSFLDDAYVTISPSPTQRNHVLSQDISLSIKGDAVLMDFVKDTWSTVFSPLSIFKSYGRSQNEETGIALIIQRTYDTNFSGSLNTEDNSITTKESQTLPSNLILELENIARIINNHYYFPQIVNWISSGSIIYITSVKPMSNNKSDESSRHFQLKGRGSQKGISSGPIHKVNNDKDMETFKNGSVLVTESLNDNNSYLLKNANAAIVEDDSKLYDYSENSGDSIPIIFGARNASSLLNNGEIVTVNSIKGEAYKGGMYNSVEKNIKRNLNLQTATKIFITLSDDSESVNNNNIDGIIFSTDDIIKNIGIHPKKIIADQKEVYFIDKIANNITAVSKKFKNNFVMCNLSNLTTDEYQNLEFGSQHETQELNPEIGFRGSLRHITNEDILELEVNAIKKAFTLGSSYLGIVIPYVRSSDELSELIRILKNHGLERSSKFRIWISVETPAVALTLDKFIDQGIDGIMIDPVSLLSFMLGADSSNPEIFHRYKYSDDSLMPIITKSIEYAQKNKVFTCLDQSRSLQIELIRKSIFLGINAVNIQNSDLNSAKMLITQSERELLRK